MFPIPCLARDHLAGHHRDQREHQAGAHADHDLGKRRREHNAQQTRARVHAHRRRRPEHLLLHRAGALIAVVDDRQRHAEKDDQDFGGSPTPSQSMMIGINAAFGTG